MNVNSDKLAELILYVSDRHAADETFGSVRLAKTLFYTDFLFYARMGRPITGETYVRGSHGPMPAHLLDTCDRMRREHALLIEERLVHGSAQDRPIATRRADLSAFTAEEVAVIDYVQNQLEGFGESELEHRFKAWELAEEGEEIPYHTAFLSGRAANADDHAFARKLAREHIQGAA
jgi:hypothetical protein